MRFVEIAAPHQHAPPDGIVGDHAGEADWLARDAIECLPAGALAERLAVAARDSRPLRVKLGIDPTAPDIHLGFTVVLGKLREFQELGHTVVLIIGDWTALVGDPSGRSETRPELSREQIEANAATFADQAMKVLRPDRLEVRRNSEWLDMPLERLFGLLRGATVAQLTERDDIAKRLASGTPVSLLELLYPVLQAYDSVAIEADVELGGTDQHFNLLLGRDFQRQHGLPEQVAMELAILVGTDGTRKMSKSLGNYIGVSESADEIFGKTMSIPDDAIEPWSRALLGSQPDPGLSARDAKRSLAVELADRFAGEGSGAKALAEFDRRFVDGGLPTDPDVHVFDLAGADVVHMPALISTAFGISRSEARRALSAGAVRIDGNSVAEIDLSPGDVDGRILQHGKLNACRIELAGAP